MKAEAAKDGSYGLYVPAGNSSVAKPIVEANTTYIFSCDFKSSAGVKPVIYFKHMDGTTDVDQTEWYPEPDGANWTHFSMEVNSDVYTKLKFQLCAGNKTETHFDNVSLIKKATEPEEPEEPEDPEEPVVENLIANGDFETGDGTDWVLLGGSEVKAEAAKDGSYGLYVPAGSAYVGGVTKPVVEANTTYRFSFDFKSPAGDEPLVYFKHMDGTTDVDQTVIYPEPDGANWTHFSVEVNSDVYTKLKFQLYAGEKATEKYFDNVTLVKVGATEPEEPEDPVEPSFDGYIANGDFETGDYTGWGGAGNMQIATTNVHSGKYAAMVSGKQWSGLLQRVKVAPNTDYKYTFWVRYEYGLNEQTLFVKAGDKNLSNHAIKPGKLGEWTKYEIAINSGEYTELALQFCITSNEEAVLVYDDISFTQVGGITFDGYLYNGSFETGDKTKWSGGSSFEIVTDAQDGAFALHITGDNWANIGQQISVKANTDYTVVLWAKKAKGSGQFALLYKDENQTKNVDQFYIDPTDDWEEYKWTFNTGEYANGYFRIMADSSTNTAYVDNISIVEGVPSAPNGLIANGDFETGDLTDWENIHSESVVVNTDKQEGEYALHLKGNQWSAVRQTVATEKNTDYVLTFYVKRLAGFDKMAVWLKDGDNNLLNPEGKEIGLEYAVTESDGWLKVEHIFNSYNQTQVDVLFGIMAAGNEVLIDNIHLDVYEKPAVEPLVLYSWGQVANRPNKASDNLIVNGSFESAEGAQWNTAGFINEYVSVVEDATAKDGNKVLYFNSHAATEKTMYVFWVDVEPNTNYTFSAFVKGAFMSRENRCTATFGVVDPDEMTFLIYDGEKGKNSKEYYQMVPPSWDNVWHLRSVAFNSGEKTKIGIAVYGVASQMYLDDIALFKSDAGAKYTVPVMTDVVSTNILSKHAGCDPQDNLVGNFNLNDVEDTFWSAGYGWKNGTLCIREDEYGYGNSLQYTASDDPVGIHYIRWIDVEPNTAYTFSVDLLVQESGNGYLALIDSKPSKPAQFINLQFSTDVFGEEWIKFYIDFNTGCYDRIGIAIVDKGGQALLDNIRIFKTVDGKDVIDDFVAAKTGWEKDGSKWIYFEDGDQVYGKWIQDGGAWYYIGADGYMVANKWMKDSKGWCWLTSSGKMAVNAWVMDSKGWCYVGDDGYCVTNTWKKDSIGWCYLDENGSMVKNDWVVDGNDWYLLDANGYMVANKWVHDGIGWVYLEGSGRLAANKWVKDSTGWCYLGADGYMVTDKWIKDSVGWCYVGADGYCVTNAWKKDSKGWVYLDGNGRMVTNKWVKDSVGWCYVGADGYAVTNCWKKDSIGWCYLNANGSMTKNGWVYDGGQWYYLDGNGYMVANKSLTIKDKTYHFNTFGVCTNP